MKPTLMFMASVMSSFLTGFSSAGNDDLIYLWPNEVPGQNEKKAPPVISENRKNNVTRISHITDPALVVFKAQSSTHNGAAVLVCPGGGYNVLSIDSEGHEVAQRLSRLGYTAFVLQYRVPKKQDGALQDAQRAIRYVRGNHKKWQLDKQKIGFLGFSAGASLSARISTRYNETLYPAIDQFDALSSRPDFSLLIYPAYLDLGENRNLTPELAITQNTPPMFIYVSADDKFLNSSLVMANALKAGDIPFELHVMPNGGHGYGLRKGNRAAETWPKLAEEWMRATIF